MSLLIRSMSGRLMSGKQTCCFSLAYFHDASHLWVEDISVNIQRKEDISSYHFMVRTSERDHATSSKRVISTLVISSYHCMATFNSPVEETLHSVQSPHS